MLRLTLSACSSLTSSERRGIQIGADELTGGSIP
jgi:hypothetical protein